LGEVACSRTDASTIHGGASDDLSTYRFVGVSLGAALALGVSGCSDIKSTDSVGLSAGDSDKPSVTTVDLRLNGEPVDLTGAVSKCYDYEGHLMVEVRNADDPDASHFLMDYYQEKVALSIGFEAAIQACSSTNKAKVGRPPR
jgi:hypothetical protein